MAFVMMGGTDENSKPIFHDFLGMSCGNAIPAVRAESGGENKALEGAEASASAGASPGGHELVSGISDLCSEKQSLNNFEGFQFHGGRSDISEPEVCNQFLGRKRSNSDSAFMGMMRERMFPVASDSHESSHLTKMLGKEVMSERPRISHDDVVFTMQSPPRPSSTSLILHPPVSGRHDLVVSKWERSMPMNAGQMVHYPSRFGRSGKYVDKISSSCTYRDSSAGVTVISQAAADEGSRTGIKGAGILSVINSGGGAGEINSTGTLPSIYRQKASPQNTDPEPSSGPSRHGISTACQQMTIFYAGQAHVFDDVDPNKADIIMTIAGSTGGSWSTSYSAKSSIRPRESEAKVSGVENEMGMSNLPFAEDLNSRLAIRGNSSHGFGRVAGMPAMGEGDPPNLISGALQAGRAVRDMRPTTQAGQPDTEGKRHV